MEPKDHTFKENIVRQVMEAVETGLMPNITVPDCGGSIVPPLPIDRKELIDKQISHMNK